VYSAEARVERSQAESRVTRREIALDGGSETEAGMSGEGCYVTGTIPKHLYVCSARWVYFVPSLTIGVPLYSAADLYALSCVWYRFGGWREEVLYP
jgi:hypothetical protein